ncbi:MAG: hypothetical protein J6W33_01615 [Spirochaetia bacterium]|nr:hypothetical protein [Spirochaetia bacterium]
MNIKDIITLVRAGYTKDEINATLAAAAASEEPAAPVDMPDMAADPAPAAADLPAEDPRIAQLEAQVKELQGKLIQLNSVNTIPSQVDPMIEIGNALINGGKKL